MDQQRKTSLTLTEAREQRDRLACGLNALALKVERGDLLLRARRALPADEPLFLLRGQDRLAGNGVTAYLVGCAEKLGTEEMNAHTKAVADALTAFYEWQRDHPDRLKLPD
jgi:hypothetical protein